MEFVIHKEKNRFSCAPPFSSKNSLLKNNRSGPSLSSPFRWNLRYVKRPTISTSGREPVTLYRLSGSEPSLSTSRRARSSTSLAIKNWPSCGCIRRTLVGSTPTTAILEGFGHSSIPTIRVASIKLSGPICSNENVAPVLALQISVLVIRVRVSPALNEPSKKRLPLSGTLTEAAKEIVG